MGFKKTFIYLRNALTLFFIDRDNEPYRAGDELAKEVNCGLDVAFADLRCDRSAEKEVYKDCMLKEFNRKVKK